MKYYLCKYVPRDGSVCPAGKLRKKLSPVSDINQPFPSFR
jgi:hypothetical protein